MPKQPKSTVAASTDTALEQIEPGDPFKLVSVKAAAEKRGVTYWQMHKDLEAGLIPSCYQGRRRYVRESDLHAFIDGLFQGS